MDKRKIAPTWLQITLLKANVKLKNILPATYEFESRRSFL